jgi:plasmid rolling circle replication initiator protein Rep
MNVKTNADAVAAVSSDNNHLTDISPRDKPWDGHRHQASKVQALYEETGGKRYAERMQDCSRLLDFTLNVSDEGEIKLRLYGARFCRVRQCPICQWRRTLMWQARFHKAIPRLMADHPTLRFIFLTLTVRNCAIDKLRSQLAQMNQAWQRLTQRVSFPAVGWVKSVEVTRGEDGSAHPHFHCLLAVKSTYFKGTNYLSQAKWGHIWQESLRVEYTPIVHVQTVKTRKTGKSESVAVKNEIVHDVQLDLPNTDAVMSAVKETLKYSIKPSDLTANKDWLAELTKQIHKTRAVALGGLFKEYLSEDEPEDLIHTELEESEIIEELGHVLFDWVDNARRYTQRKDN